jgi:hypothetical protein
MFVSVDRPTNNNFAECAIWTGDIGEMTVGAAPTKHEVSGGYQMRHTPHGSGPGQFGPVMTRFRNTQGDMVKIQVPAGVDLAMAKRPTISDASGSRLIFTFWDFPEDTLASSSAAEQAEPAETVTARSSQITADGLRSVFSRWKKRK